MNEHRSAFERATSGYDAQHEAALFNAISRAIAETSYISDPPVVCIRTGEIAAALVSVLIPILALSPSATRSPTAIRKLTDDLRARLIRRVGDAVHDPATHDFLARCFRDDDAKRGGNA